MNPALAVALVLILILCGHRCHATMDIMVGDRKFPAEICTKSGIPQPFSLAAMRNMSVKVAAPLKRFYETICSLKNNFDHMTKKVATDLGRSVVMGDDMHLFSVFAQAPDLRAFCRLAGASMIKANPSGTEWFPEKPQFKCDGPNVGVRPWEHMRLNKFQTCVLLYLMCISCYVYGRVMSLMISPIARLRRLNWTKENFIWAYKNF